MISQIQKAPGAVRGAVGLARHGLLSAVRAASLATLPAVIAAASGCGPTWYFTFVEAENIARPNEKPVFIFYRDPFDPRSGQMYETIRSPQIAELVRNMICCTLVTEYDPNRRYMAQFGIVDAPALAIVHPDGTYHSRAGFANLEEIRRFLINSKPPGEKIKVDIQIPRPTDYLLRAEGIYEDALSKAHRLNRKLMIVYKWWLDADSTEMLRRLAKPEVAVRVTEFVHCVLDWDFVPNRTNVAQYGVTKFPAIIIVDQDGSYHVLNGLVPAEEVVRFLSRAESEPGRHGLKGTTVVPSPPRWDSNYGESRMTAARTRRGLFIFYHSVFSDESNAMARLLETDAAVKLLSQTVNCRLDASEVRNRELMSEYGVSRPPGFVAMRPDGVFTAREGEITIDQLRRMYAFLAGP